MDPESVIDVKDTTLDEWLAMVRKPGKRVFWRSSFPTNRHRDAFYETLASRSEGEVKLLLRHFLVSTGSNPVDVHDAEYTVHRIRAGEIGPEDLTEHQRRHVRFALSKGREPVWEGVHWVLDLLPHQPRRALDVLDSFFFVRAGVLKDSYLYGISDSQALIRAFYIAKPATGPQAAAVLHSLSWRDLEWLCGVLYDHMGYDVTVTPRSNDEGIDVLAARDELGRREQVAVQAKKYSGKNTVTKADWRELLGAITDQKVSRGVLLTTGRLESGVRAKGKEDSRIQVIEAGELLEMLNEHVGTNWHRRIDHLMSEQKQKSL